MNGNLPTQARVVIVGGGIVGCSVAYHLTKLGWTDVVLLEQGRLSGGTTWHAAGLVGQLRTHRNLTALAQYSTDLYDTLEAETGLATGWKRCGSVSVARCEERMVQLMRSASMARAFGVEVERISPEEAGKLWPPMRTDDLVGAVWIPGDGSANPTDLTQALAKGARMGGARVFEKIRVTGIRTEGGAVSGVETASGDIACEIVVNCAGQWGREVGRMCGVTVPLFSCEHMYIVAKDIEGATPDLPVLRDPDGYTYFKEEVGGLVAGGFEPHAKPWGMDGIPADFEFSLLPDDWDQFEILMENSLLRVPALETAEIRQFINGPESFTPDNNFILGEAPELKNFFVNAGFNSMGIAAGGGAGKALAEWIAAGEPTMDLWPVDIRRFARFNGNDTWLQERVKEVLGLHYVMAWWNRELDSARPLRRSPLYDRLAAKGACFGTKMGWERANWFAPEGIEPKIEYSWGRQNWFPHSAEEHRATREAVTVFDQTSFSKYLVQGRDAEAVMQRLCANDVGGEPGRMVYTGLLNEKGGYEGDLTVTRWDANTYFVVSGSAQTTRDLDWIGRNIPEDAHAVVTDVTSAWSVIGVQGPNSRTLLARLTRADLSNDAFPFATMREIDLGYATVRAGRMTYVGELGWEIYVPTDFAVTVYDAIVGAGADLELRDAGYYALESLRVEKGFRAWGREVTPDYTPYEAGLGFAVRLDKKVPFIGRDALLRQKEAGVKRRLAFFTLDDPEALPLGGESILRDGETVGEITSAAYGHTLGCAVGLGYVHNEGGVDKAFIESGTYRIDIAGETFAARAHMRTPYDPKAERVRG
jgi:glycine cleavage system aminomethyltransferase T/glycine/D-amino acid oxidase-like deaminating enzyme